MRSIGRRCGTVVFTAIMVAGLGGCGIGSGSTTTTVTSTATVTSATAPTGSYVGTTSQGLPISFTVSPNAVLSLSFGWRAKCADGQVHSNMINLGGAPIHDGNFSMGGTLNTGGVAHVEGKLDGGTASGQLSRARGSAFGTDCVATGITWKAHAGTG